MRIVSFLLILALAGCDLGGRVAKGDDAPAAPKESYTAAVARFEATVAGMAETQGNTNAELEAIKEELKALKKQVADLNLLLTVDAEISVPVPKAIDAPPVEKVEQRLTFQGKPIDAAAWLKRSVITVEIRGDVDKHLRDHGLEGDFSGYSREQKIKLHSVAHSYGIPLKSSQKPPKVAAIPAPIIRPFVQYGSGNCRNGNCARQQMTWFRR
jgi:hypothetical protein